mmetsp:Transcript_11131/g.22021  ORF Transcript_11131/g.22021 Transcript_11131/m.22021 type:complete len:272 (-) Transcript_11131:485-1300(-)
MTRHGGVRPALYTAHHVTRLPHSLPDEEAKGGRTIFFRQNAVYRRCCSAFVYSGGDGAGAWQVRYAVEYHRGEVAVVGASVVDVRAASERRHEFVEQVAVPIGRRRAGPEQNPVGKHLARAHGERPSGSGRMGERAVDGDGGERIGGPVVYFGYQFHLLPVILVIDHPHDEPPIGLPQIIDKQLSLPVPLHRTLGQRKNAIDLPPNKLPRRLKPARLRVRPAVQFRPQQTGRPVQRLRHAQRPDVELQLDGHAKEQSARLRHGHGVGPVSD